MSQQQRGFPGVRSAREPGGLRDALRGLRIKIGTTTVANGTGMQPEAHMQTVAQETLLVVGSRRRNMGDTAGEATARQAPDGAGPPGPSNPGDQEILAALKRSELHRASSLCAHYHGPAIGRVCMAIVGSQAEADDLTQETLMVAHDSWDTYRRKGSLSAWLLSIARRRCARYLKRHVKQRTRLRLVPPREPGPQGEELLVRRQRAERARRALDELCSTDREALVLHYVCGLTYKELASACSIEEPAARQRVSRALVRLRGILKQGEHGYE